MKDCSKSRWERLAWQQVLKMIQRVLVDYKLKMGQEYDLILKKLAQAWAVIIEKMKWRHFKRNKVFSFFLSSKDKPENEENKTAIKRRTHEGKK